MSYINKRTDLLQALLGRGTNFPRWLLKHALDVSMPTPLARWIIGTFTPHLLLAAGILV